LRKLWNSVSDIVSFQSLTELAIQYSGCPAEVEAEDVNGVAITYIDEDEDGDGDGDGDSITITISSDEELAEALEKSSKPHISMMKIDHESHVVTSFSENNEKCKYFHAEDAPSYCDILPLLDVADPNMLVVGQEEKKLTRTNLSSIQPRSRSDHIL